MATMVVPGSFYPAPTTARPKAAPASSSATPSPCACSKAFNLTCEQGATLSTQITLTLNAQPVDITGAEFQFTAKVNVDIADFDPGVVKVDWNETSTSIQGITWLTIPAATTAAMQLAPYVYQVRMVSSSGIVTPIVHGTLTITQPVSSRST